MEVLKTRKAIFFADRVQLIGFGNVAAAAAGGGRAFPPVFCFGAVRVSFAAAFQFCRRSRLVPVFRFAGFSSGTLGDIFVSFCFLRMPAASEKAFLSAVSNGVFFVLTGYRPGDRTRWPQPCPLPFVCGIIRLSRLKRRAGFVYRSRKSEKRCLYTP